MNTIILVDSENINSEQQLQTILSFYTKETLFCFFGNGTIQKKRFERLKDVFTFHKNQYYNGKHHYNVPDASDTLVTDYVAKNMVEWKLADVENVLVCSNDHFATTLCIMLKSMFKVWLMGSKAMKVNNAVYNCRKVGVVIPYIMIK